MHGVEVGEALQGLPGHEGDLLLGEGAGDVVDVLQGPAPAVLHAYPQLVSPEIGTKVGNNIWMSAVLHHENLLLDDTEVIPRLQFYHFYGGIFTCGQSLGLKQNLHFGERKHIVCDHNRAK